MASLRKTLLKKGYSRQTQSAFSSVDRLSHQLIRTCRNIFSQSRQCCAPLLFGNFSPFVLGHNCAPCKPVSRSGMFSSATITLLNKVVRISSQNQKHFATGASNQLSSRRFPISHFHNKRQKCFPGDLLDRHLDNTRFAGRLILT